MRRTLLVCAATTSILGALLLPAAATPAATLPATVEITKFTFEPKEITVTPGSKIMWINRDEAPHTVAGTDKTFTSKGLDTGDRFEQTFPKEGDYAYYCTVHPFMTGVVHVRKK